MIASNTKRIITWFAVLCSIIFVIALARPAPGSAYSSYAAATGQTCGTCHVNPAGGGARNATGLAFQAIPTHATDPAGAWAQLTAPIPTPTPPPPSLTPTPVPTAPTPAPTEPPAPVVTPAPSPTTNPSPDDDEDDDGDSDDAYEDDDRGDGHEEREGRKGWEDEGHGLSGEGRGRDGDREERPIRATPAVPAVPATPGSSAGPAIPATPAIRAVPGNPAPAPSLAPGPRRDLHERDDDGERSAKQPTTIQRNEGGEKQRERSERRERD